VAAFGGILIIAGVLVVRQVAVGRARNLPEDTAAFFTALFSGNYATINETAKKRGAAS
jgi:xanthine/uracil/vitamin C permease (AzgA family)